MSELKVGDKVRVKEHRFVGEEEVGSIGEVVDISIPPHDERFEFSFPIQVLFTADGSDLFTVDDGMIPYPADALEVVDE